MPGGRGRVRIVGIMPVMKKEYGTLRRRTLLTPVWIAGMGAVIAAVALAVAGWVWVTAGSTVVVLVRHAEKMTDEGSDPHLSAAGQARAELLGRMFGNGAALGRLDAIYVSPTRRSHETAAPLAARLHLPLTQEQQDDLRALVHRVMREHAGGRVLIVGHSDTVPDLVKDFSGEGPVPEIADDEFGTMYIVEVPRLGHANVLRLTY